MRRSELFIKTKKDAPAEEVSKNAQLLIRAGYVYKVMAGVYAYTPLGIRVLENIKNIVREEMNAIGGQELIMSSLQRKETWEATGRWDDEVVDVWFKSKLKDDTEIGLAWSHEEAIIEMLKQHISSYKDFPVNVYQFQTKLRNELRAKSGIMRGREFVMKDMYSCSVDEEQHERFYQSCIDAYMRVYQRLGIAEDTFVTFASGGAFTKFSHEFQTICDAGEDVIYINRDRNIAINEEVLNEDTLTELGITRDDLTMVKTAEVGNIFNFGTQKSQEMDFTFTDSEGKRQHVHLGSYGIGITRVMGVLVEKMADSKGIVWPLAVAPFKVYLTTIGDDPEIINSAQRLHDQLESSGNSVLWDDRKDARPGEKFADGDLIGVPHRIVISQRHVNDGNFEYKYRTSEDSELLTADELFAKISSVL